MTDKAKKELVMEVVAEVTPQIFINAVKICTFNSDKWSNDLAAHILESFLEMPLDKQYKIAIEDNSLENYLTRSMALGIRSSSSPFFFKYRKSTYMTRELYPNSDYSKYGVDNSLDTDENKEEQLDKIKEYVDSLDFYDKHLITEHYYNGIPAKRIADTLNINPSTIISDIRRVLKGLKKHISNE